MTGAPTPPSPQPPPMVEWAAVVNRLLANAGTEYAEWQRKVAILEATVEKLQGDLAQAQETVESLQGAIRDRDDALNRDRVVRLGVVTDDDGEKVGG